jgi:hypothetical protein
MVIVQTTADDYLLLQADALKLRPPTRLPDLEHEILDPLLKAPVAFLGRSASGIFSALSGPLTPLVLDIAAALKAFEPDLTDCSDDEIILEAGAPSEPVPLPFDAATIARAETFARATILAAGSITLGDILARAAKEDGDDTGFQRCLFLILEQAIDPRTADIAGEASILGVRFDAGFVEGTDVRFTGKPIRSSHAS